MSWFRKKETPLKKYDSACFRRSEFFSCLSALTFSALLRARYFLALDPTCKIFTETTKQKIFETNKGLAKIILISRFTSKKKVGVKKKSKFRKMFRSESNIMQDWSSFETMHQNEMDLNFYQNFYRPTPFCFFILRLS